MAKHHMDIISKLFLSLLVLIICCDRYKHTNPHDPDYEGQFWNSDYAILKIAEYTVIEDYPDINHRYFEIELSITNTGASAALQVNAYMYEYAPFFELLLSSQDTLFFGDILPADSISTEWPWNYEFRVPRDAIPPLEAIFYLDIFDNSDNVWQDSLFIEILD